MHEQGTRLLIASYSPEYTTPTQKKSYY
jgi:hypothetical protein